MSYKLKNRIENFFIYIFMTIVLIIVLFPIIYVFASSFKTNAEVLVHPERIFPENPTLDNYKIALTSKDFNVIRMFINSVIYAGSAVAITLWSSSTIGYVFARGKFPLKNMWFTIFTALMFINFGGVTVYATFNVLRAVHLTQSITSLIIMKLFGVPVVNIYLVRSYIKTLPYELDEAAKIDGCSFIGIFFKIIAPLLLPLFATLGLLAFQGSWNDYIMPTVFTITRPEQRTLIVGIMALKNSGEGAANWNLMLAASAIAILPMLCAYMFAKKYFVKGLVGGAVKG